MSELEKFMAEQTNKSALTQKQYRLQYNKLHKLLDKDISDRNLIINGLRCFLLSRNTDNLNQVI